MAWKSDTTESPRTLTANPSVEDPVDSPPRELPGRSARNPIPGCPDVGVYSFGPVPPGIAPSRNPQRPRPWRRVDSGRAPGLSQPNTHPDLRSRPRRRPTHPRARLDSVHISVPKHRADRLHQDQFPRSTRSRQPSQRSSAKPKSKFLSVQHGDGDDRCEPISPHPGRRQLLWPGRPRRDWLAALKPA